MDSGDRLPRITSHHPVTLITIEERPDKHDESSRNYPPNSEQEYCDCIRWNPNGTNLKTKLGEFKPFAKTRFYLIAEWREGRPGANKNGTATAN